MMADSCLPRKKHRPCIAVTVLVILVYYIYQPHESIRTCYGVVTFQGDVADPIPRIIHSFESNESSPVEYAIEAYGRAQRVKVMSNNYTHERWNTSRFYSWMSETHAWYLPIAATLPAHRVRDIAPFFILQSYGGIMFSLSYIPRVDIYPYLSPERVNMLESNAPYTESVSSAVLASRAGHPFWVIVHEKLLDAGSDLKPSFLGDVTARYSSMTYLLPCKNFNRVSEKVPGVKKNTPLVKKCGVEEDPCLYGSLQ
jgi:mannosyltransferase OCH1-like enzyme